MSKTVLVIAGVLSIAMVFSGIFIWYAQQKSNSMDLADRIDRSLQMANSWYQQAQQHDGSFLYEIRTRDGSVPESNNIVRQAGSLYSLAQYYRYAREKDTRQTLERGFSYFETLLVPQGEQMAAVVHEGSKQSNTSALLLLGMVEFLEADSRKNVNPQLEESARKLANYLHSTQLEDGGFVNYYGPPQTESDYNNGETLYALIRAYNYFKDERFLDASKKAADHFIGEYSQKDWVSSFYAWAMAGYAHLYRITKDESYWMFMKQETARYLEVSPSLSKTNAVFLEGGLHVIWIARERDNDFANTLLEHVSAKLAEIHLYQIGMPAGKLQSDRPRISGAVCTNELCTKTRIDYTHHLMSANYLYTVYSGR